MKEPGFSGVLTHTQSVRDFIRFLREQTLSFVIHRRNICVVVELTLSM